jgi:hypothetical protein
VHVTNDADGIERGLREAVSNHAGLVQVADEARDLQRRRWESQLAGLRRLVAGESVGATPRPVAESAGEGR